MISFCLPLALLSLTDSAHVRATGFISDSGSIRGGRAEVAWALLEHVSGELLILVQADAIHICLHGSLYLILVAYWRETEDLQAPCVLERVEELRAVDPALALAVVGSGRVPVFLGVSQVPLA